jgi:signal transduction histidine kinase
MAGDSQRYHLERQRAEEVLAAANRRAETDATLFAALARVGREMISLLDTPVILDRLCRLSTEVLDCDWGATWLWQPAEEEYVCVASHGAAPAHAARIGSSAIADLVARLRQEDVIGAEGTDGLPAPEGTLVVLHGVLRHGDELIGIQSAGRTRGDGFDARQARMMGGITQLVSLALANARLIGQLEHASRLKSEFVSTMSHELRTPLNVILGYADMMEDGELKGSERDAAVGRIKGAGRDLLDLIESTLEIGRMEAGRDEVRFETVSVATFWSKLGEGCARLPRRPGVALEWSDALPDVALVTDPRKLTVVVRNLVGNALKFTERGRVPVDAALVDEGFVLRISDTGMGSEPRTRTSSSRCSARPTAPTPAATAERAPASTSSAASSTRWAARSRSRANRCAAPSSPSPCHTRRDLVSARALTPCRGQRSQRDNRPAKNRPSHWPANSDPASLPRRLRRPRHAARPVHRAPHSLPVPARDTSRAVKAPRGGAGPSACRSPRQRG